MVNSMGGGGGTLCDHICLSLSLCFHSAVAADLLQILFWRGQAGVRRKEGEKKSAHGAASGRPGEVCSLSADIEATGDRKLCVCVCDRDSKIKITSHSQGAITALPCPPN